MTVSPQPSHPGLLPGLDELFRGSEPVGDLSDLAIPDFFESDEEYEEFQAWLKAQRAADVA